MFDNCDGADVDNVNVLCANILNDDAFDICSSRNFTFRNCFARAQDDIIAVKGTRENNCENIHCENCKLWTDKANIWRIGYECECQAMRNITAKDIDVLHYSIDYRSPTTYWANCIFFIQPSNNMVIEDCLFEDIRINASDNDALLIDALPCYTGYQHKYSEAGDARNITFRNISVTGDKSVFTGRVYIDEEDKGHTVSDIKLENITFFGKKKEFKEEIYISE